MEYRGWIKVPGFDIESDEADELIGALEERWGETGPVFGGDRNGIEVVMSLNEADENERVASARMLGMVTDALIFVGTPERPASIELEPVD